MRSTSVKVLSVLAAGALMAAAGCSSGSDSSGGTGTSAPGGQSTIAPAGNLQLSQPVRFVSLISDPGNSTDPNAVADFNDGARLAVEQINAAGGLGGHPVELSAVDTPPVGDAVVGSLETALTQDPTVILGPVSSSTAVAIAPRIAEVGVPMLQNTTESRLALSGGAGNEWIFATRPLNSAMGEIAGRFAVEELGAHDVGLMYVTAPFGQEGAMSIKGGVDAAGGQVTAEQSFEFNATDLTDAAQGMQGTQAIVDWGTPNTLDLSVQTLNQQGLGAIPQVGPGSVGFSSFVAGIEDPAWLTDVYGTLDCNPADDDRPRTQQFRQDFIDAYGYEPSYASAEMYDSVLMVRDIVEKAGSASHATIRDGLASLDWSGGVCADRYVNRDNVLVHQAVMTRFEGTSLVTVRQYDDI